MSVYLIREVIICNMFTLHISYVKATLWIHHWLLFLFLFKLSASHSYYNLMGKKTIWFFFKERIWKKMFAFFFCRLSRDLKFLGYTLYYYYKISFNNSKKKKIIYLEQAFPGGLGVLFKIDIFINGHL